MITGRPRERGVDDFVATQVGHEVGAGVDRVDAAWDAELPEFIERVVSGRRRPGRCEGRCDIVQAAADPDVGRSSVGPPLPVAVRLAVAPIALVNQVAEPVDVLVGVRVVVPQATLAVGYPGSADAVEVTTDEYPRF